MQKNARSPFAPNFAGIALGGMGKHREAVIQFRKALKLDPGCHDARKNLAQSLILLNDPATAVNVLTKLQELTPQDAGVWYLLAQAHTRLGQPEQADEAATRSIDLAPNQPRAYNLRALVRDQMGQVDEALKDYQASLQLNPNDVDTLINISLPLARQSRHKEAMQAANRAVEIAPDNADARATLAAQLVSRGDYQDGMQQYRRVLELDPTQSDAFEQLAALQTPEQNLKLAQMARAALKKAPQKTRSRAGLLFALSKIEEKSGHQPESDAFLASANKVMATILPYNAKADSAQIEKLMGRIDTPARAGDAPVDGPMDGPVPIYVVGLPHSGTSLCEAILGAHPDIAPFGDRTAAGILLKDVANEIIPFDGAPAQSFIARDQRLLPQMPEGTAAYVDKMPENYRLLGFLGTAYPHCKIINLRRDPRDIALSMWRGNFAGSALAYTYDLSAMAHRFNLYAKMMLHWHKVLPDRIMDLRYEDMVADIDASSRALAAFCGVDWTPGMARPDLNAEQVLTMSATQLRQPVHSRSVGKWRQHAAVLAPFIAGLDPALWPEIA